MMTNSEENVPSQPDTAPPDSDQLPDDAAAGLGSSDGHTPDENGDAPGTGDAPNDLDDDPSNPVTIAPTD